MLYDRPPPRIVTPKVGSYIVTDFPMCGLGGLISTAASWLTVPTDAVYVYMANHWYAARNGKDHCNKWDWFFNQQLLDIPYRICRGRNANVYAKHRDQVIALRNLAKKHWTVKTEILAEAAKYLPDPNNTLGLHVRGTDKKVEVPRPSVEVIERTVRQVLEKRNLKQILLATDDGRFLMELLERFPGLLWFPPHLRGFTDTGLHAYFKSYRQARETMVEIIALAQTAHVVIGQSSVAEAILIFGKDGQGWTYYQHPSNVQALS